MNHPTTRAALALFVSLLIPATALGRQEATRPATQPTTNPFKREMTVSPAKAEDAVPPSERADPFAFSQDALKLRHENAATLYLQGFPMVSKRYGEKREVFDRLEAQSIHELDRAMAKELFGSTGVEISEPAVRRTFADWGSPVDELGIETLLPYLSECRLVARALTLEARVLALEGKHKEASDALRRVYVLGQHLGNARQPVLIDGLVGVGIASLATEGAVQIAQLELSPNRYWALTTLPGPMFDIGGWIRSERIFLTVSLPALLNPPEITQQQWQETLRKLLTYTSGSDGEATIAELARDPAATEALAARARTYLRERGYTEEQLEAMGAAAVAATFVMEDYRARFDAMAKLVYLPLPQSLPLLAEQERRMKPGQGEPEPGVLAQVLLPALSRGVAAPYRLERQIGALRIVEAMRDHAAHHDGALPASLAELRLPVPEDPMTGEPFGYAVAGNTFTLTAPRYLENDPNSSLEWRVTMRR